MTAQNEPYRPRLTHELAADLRVASGLAGMTVPEYLEKVVAPFVSTDLQARIERKHLQRVAGVSDD